MAVAVLHRLRPGDFASGLRAGPGGVDGVEQGRAARGALGFPAECEFPARIVAVVRIPDCGSYVSVARGTVLVAVVCLTLSRAPQDCFRHCGSSASYIAAFDPQSCLSDRTEGTLSHSVVAEWVPRLSFPALAHDHAGGRRKGRMKGFTAGRHELPR